MQQHFSSEELQQLYDWEQLSGKVANIKKVDGGFIMYHVEDKEHKIDMCFMEEEYMLRRWIERMAYKTSDGKTAEQFEMDIK